MNFLELFEELYYLSRESTQTLVNAFEKHFEDVTTLILYLWKTEDPWNKLRRKVDPHPIFVTRFIYQRLTKLGYAVPPVTPDSRLSDFQWDVIQVLRNNPVERFTSREVAEAMGREDVGTVTRALNALTDGCTGVVRDTDARDVDRFCWPAHAWEGTAFDQQMALATNTAMWNRQRLLSLLARIRLLEQQITAGQKTLTATQQIVDALREEAQRLLEETRLFEQTHEKGGIPCKS